MMITVSYDLYQGKLWVNLWENCVHSDDTFGEVFIPSWTCLQGLLLLFVWPNVVCVTKSVMSDPLSKLVTVSPFVLRSGGRPPLLLSASSVTVSRCLLSRSFVSRSMLTRFVLSHSGELNPGASRGFLNNVNLSAAKVCLSVRTFVNCM